MSSRIARPGTAAASFLPAPGTPRTAASRLAWLCSVRVTSASTLRLFFTCGAIAAARRRIRTKQRSPLRLLMLTLWSFFFPEAAVAEPEVDDRHRVEVPRVAHGGAQV